MGFTGLSLFQPYFSGVIWTPTSNRFETGPPSTRQKGSASGFFPKPTVFLEWSVWQGVFDEAEGGGENLPADFVKNLTADERDLF